jgi:serine/threonine protein phosphatase PrpC
MEHASRYLAAPLSSALKFEFAGGTDIGRARVQNEDNFAFDPVRGIAVLADGMGGCAGGEFASAIAVTIVMRRLRTYISAEDVDQRPSENNLSQASGWVCDAVAEANQEIFDAALCQPSLWGMGTTLVVALFHGGLLTIVNIGDSRLYRWRRNQLLQLTVDHTVVQEQVDAGLLTPELARWAAEKGILTRAMGAEPHITLDLFEQDLMRGDIYLICSDGLFDMLQDSEIASILDAHGELPQRAVDALIEAANAAGGLDNVSVIVVRVDQAPASMHF